jgi:hypothetical protein
MMTGYCDSTHPAGQSSGLQLFHFPSKGELVSKHPTIHIYTLSRLVHAPAAGWEKLIDQIEAGRQKAYAYYLPVREAVVRFCGGGGKDFEEILADMKRRAEVMGGMRGPKVASDNENAFVTFVEEFYPKISKFKRNLLHDTQSGVMLEGVALLGAPHFVAVDQKGETRYVFLYPAKWKPNELKSYLLLLATIVEERYGGMSGQIWCMDLRTGKTVKFKRTARLSSRCSAAAKHYARVAGLI